MNVKITEQLMTPRKRRWRKTRLTPVAGATFSIRDCRGEVVEYTTDKEGFVEFALLPGQYEITIRSAGTIPYTYFIEVSPPIAVVTRNLPAPVE
jgi:uncharacterized surface anchored protein